ncbi:TrpB-like pyridoxal phosphate-dependent enzyme [Roseospira visakhapatnamensis]|uniref:Tryptophan synthase beta chain n=1 Tax=Roseospira visakhapatnamensis TaxID=390880 RepID=A0A7W6WAX6_9PROT|nr:TrpB-like pyridoxal phosphate-dependent enzyme [Roseospira visakhapatnamensis]MBB4267680.1 tryptophan synthase beta chain [Roseospira visakhapatnamensis]
MSESTKYLLDEEHLPKAWYNLAADLEAPAPPVNPGTGQPMGPDDLTRLFATGVVEQEMSTERWIDIPQPVREVYRLWRPSPLIRARRLEKALDTPARIFFKYEGVSPAGSHKPNSAIAQAFYNQQDGVKRLVTETGAGQWGSSLAFAGDLFDLDVRVYMVKISFNQKPYRRALMETYGATCIASPSSETAAGRAILEANPDSNGSLGIAISEAVEIAASRDDTKYALGSVMNHVCLHQTIIGEEAMMQMEMADADPDIVIGCVGGGSNFAGLAFPYMREKLKGKAVRCIGVEPTSCPTLTKGAVAYDFGDTGKLTPLVRMHTLGSGFMPPGTHAGGLRYHGMAPMVSLAMEKGLMEARSYQQTECFAAAVTFARNEGIVPAPESSHAIKAVMDEALRCKAEGKADTILFNLSGHGHFDMQAYTDYFGGKMTDTPFDQAALDASLATLPKVAV